jgi:hypothetical protein
VYIHRQSARHLLDRQLPFFSQPIITAFQTKSSTDISDEPASENAAFPRFQTAFIQDSRYLFIGVLVE